jgi:signal transduction histidine kinase
VSGPLTDEQQKFLEIVQRNLEQLHTLISDLLDLSKLEARKVTLNVKPSSLTEIVNTVCGSLEAWTQSKSITISKRVPERLPTVLCDPDLIRRLLTNLVGNAIKFTPKQGRVTIEVKHDVAQHTITLSVADTGVGISAEDIPKLFQKFQQVGERTHTDIAGTGLGLAIAKEVVELHHGRIWAESDGKQGATFSFTLPVTAPAERG